ncbi:MAG: flippase [Candidatus Schekmanbacteria bacterium]|nr:flippase [Candidatus Schekmanbacteria bacterium]
MTGAERPRTSLRLVLFNSSTLFAAQISTRLLSLVLVVAMGHWLGSEEVGRYSFAMTVFVLLDVLGDFGLRPLLMREITREPERAAWYFSRALALKIVIVLVSTAATSLALWGAPIPAETRMLALLFLAALLPNIALATVKSVFLAMERMHIEAVAVVCQQASFALGGLAMLALGGPLELLAGWFFVTLAGAAAAVYGALRGSLRGAPARGPWRKLLSDLRGLLVQAAPFAVTGLFAILYFKVDIVMLELLRGEEEVGLYSMGYRFIEALTFVSISLMSALYPLYSRLHGKSMSTELAMLHETVAVGMAVVAVPLTLGTMALGPSVIGWLLPPSFAESGVILCLLAPALGLLTFNSVLVTLVNACDRASRVTRATAISFLFNVAANAIAIPIWGMYGAAVSTVASEGLILLLLEKDAREQVGYRLPVAALLRGPAAGGVAAVAAFAMAARWLEWGTEMAAVVGASTFLAWLGLAGVIGSGKLRDFRSVLRSG